MTARKLRMESDLYNQGITHPIPSPVEAYSTIRQYIVVPLALRE